MKVTGSTTLSINFCQTASYQIENMVIIIDVLWLTLQLVAVQFECIREVYIIILALTAYSGTSNHIVQ
jgi:hypothetical protein